MDMGRAGAGTPLPEETLDEFYEYAPCGYLTTDPQGVILRANMTIIGWLARSRAELVGRRVQDFLTHAGLIFYETHVAPLVRTDGLASQVALDLRCGDGRRLSVLSDWRRIEVGGAVAGLRVMLVDATDRRAYERDLVAARERAQAAVLRLRESETQLQVANEALERSVQERTKELLDTKDFARLALSAVGGVGVWTYEFGTDRFYCDASIAKLYDIDAKEGATGIAPARFLANVHPDDRGRLRAAMVGGLIDAGELEQEYRLVHADGSVHWVLSRGHTYFGGDALPIRRTGVGVDMTTQRQTEDQLRQSQKMEAVGQLTGGIAHDFNNLLQGITGSLDIMQRRLATGRTEDLDRWLTGAKTAATRAAALTHRLLAFSRRQPLNPRSVQANPLIVSMDEMLARTLGEQIELTFAPAAELWPTRCDPNQLENAILNLVINARDAMPDGGSLHVETYNADLNDRTAAAKRDIRPGHYVCIDVIDTGTGMTQDTISKAFEPFFTTKPIGQGTGLGLSMIYGFARQSEGYARIASEPGKGTTVTLLLPRHRSEDDGEHYAPLNAEAAARNDGETVLVVEDEEIVRSLIVEVLGELGYRAIEASDGPKGLEVLQSKRRIDFLITDIGLPGLNGRQVADAGRLLRPGLKVLFMTGYAENAALASGFLEPGMAMITKPFGMDVLTQKIREIVEERPASR